MRRFVLLPTGEKAGKAGRPEKRDAGPNRMFLIAPGNARCVVVF
ncbi:MULTISPECIES: hypothetical protein [unclassified Paenibacillus]|nr:MULTISPECIES: hypothetical protein [unclassified Paenibacillus]EGL18899.1 hypothetical protein HMPREF9413_2452 [Paenibacillus sp. HGF7]EPD92730.1 hypothetical protein HMPREF1207_00501 [Paenibacillus sp. HGH0039]